MFCLGLYPSITHPSRIIRNTATLIDNIFTNVTEGRITGGLLINDITDHLHVFLAHDVDFGIHTELKNMTLVRHVTDNAIESLRRDLMDQVWHEIFVENVDELYDKFISIITNLYNKHCPLVAKVNKSKYADKPWITKGLQNACKKKNVLYKEFIKHRTKEAENKYKKYKNKLTSIMRSSKKMYYSKLHKLNSKLNKQV